MRLAALLEAGQSDFLDALTDLTEEQSAAKPDQNQWSVLECIEHVIIVEERHLRWLDKGRSIEPQRDHDRELRLFTIMRNYLEKREAPEALRPKNRFTRLADACEAFLEARDRSIRLVDERGETLYAVGVKHPFFGPVNGAELVHLMDGHARRHADQIRSLSKPAPPPRARLDPIRVQREDSSAPRVEPRLPEELASPADPGSFFTNEANVTLDALHLRNGNARGVKALNFTASGSVVELTNFAGAEFESIVLKDVRLLNCDLAHLKVQRMVLERVEIVDCRLMGFSAESLDARDLLIQNSDVRYASLHGAWLRNCELEGSKWQEADLRSADLSGTVIRRCDLDRADLRDAKLLDTDFRTSQLEGMQVDTKDLRGAIVEPAQAMILAQRMGLRIV
ncbi:MAG: DinB family protein [Acidobacteria bacterium]|nr:DinB family protein [Acidobacteriota bacterium]